MMFATLLAARFPRSLPRSMPASACVSLPVALAAVLSGAHGAAQAYDFDSLSLLASQAEFKQVAQDLSSTLAYRPMAPAEGLGVLGFDLSASVGVTQVQSEELLQRAAGNDDDVPGALPTATLRVQKGLPFNIDLGAAYTAIPGTSAAAVSAEVKWAFFEGGVAMPALAVRGFFTRMNGLGDMKMHSQGVDVSISKGFAMVTPYAGVGMVSTKASTDSGRWASESYTQGRAFAGVNVNLAVVNLAFEADQTGDNSTLGLKLGWRF